MVVLTNVQENKKSFWTCSTLLVYNIYLTRVSKTPQKQFYVKQLKNQYILYILLELKLKILRTRNSHDGNERINIFPVFSWKNL